MSHRTNEEWKAWFSDGERPAPPASELMGFEFLDLDADTGWFECRFMGRQSFLNPGRVIQGGFLTAMLDDAMSVAAVITLDAPGWVPTLQMTTSFIRPAQPGWLYARGEVIRRGRSGIHTAGTLKDEDGRLLATATAACIPRHFD